MYGAEMDYETANGSQFSLREIWDENYEFSYTSAAAFVEGKAYAARMNKELDELDDAEIFQALEPVPTENIHPPCPSNFTRAPQFDSSKHYLKAPSFTYDDCRPGQTFVADCILNEASTLELLSKQPHPNIVGYHGCVVEGDRISRLCLSRYAQSLTDFAENGLTEDQLNKVMSDIESGLQHIHSLGLAHNDINPDNICIDSASGNAVIIDFDSCLPLGKKLLKGVGKPGDSSNNGLLSDKANDLDALYMIHDFLSDTITMEQ